MRRFLMIAAGVMPLLAITPTEAQGQQFGARCAPVEDTILSHIDFTPERFRPLQRVVFEDLTGGTNTAVPTGGVFRFYTDPIGGALTFSLPDAPTPTYAFLEVQRPDGTPACSGTGNQQGCAEVSGVWVYAAATTYFYEISAAVNGGANSTGVYHLTSQGAGPEESLATYTNAFEIRFTGSSWAIHPFTGFPGYLMGFEVPFSVWDVGPMSPGDPPDPSDDIRLIPALYSDFATVDDDMCANNATTLPYRFRAEPSAGLQTDRIYAYWPATTYEDFATAIEDSVVAVEPGPLPTGYVLLGARPNPASAGSVVQFVMAESGHARLEVLDVLGRLVAVLVDEVRSAGLNSTPLATAAMPPGSYLLRLAAGGGIASKPVAVVR